MVSRSTSEGQPVALSVESAGSGLPSGERERESVQFRWPWAVLVFKVQGNQYI